MDAKTIRTIAVLTSGGDAPGMNAAIRAVTRSAIYIGMEVIGVRRGYCGLIDKDFVRLQSHSVSKIISSGGTILKSSRFPQFTERGVRAQAVENMRQAGIDALIVIGGDGSFRGANLLHEEFSFPVVGIPGTIDNDIYGTDFTIGFDTAVNTAVGAIDKIRDTADSHNLIFFVEVMGRDSGFIGLYTAISTGAEAALIPEVNLSVEELCDYLVCGRRKNKTSGIIIVAEGDQLGSATQVAMRVKQAVPDYEIRVTTLGHIQRGGSPSCADRVLASILGHEAVNALANGRSGVMVGQRGGSTTFVPLSEACSKSNKINNLWYETAHILAL